MKKDTHKERVIQHLKKQPIIQSACAKANISRMSYYRWIQEDSEFACAAEKAIIEGRHLINDMCESQLISAIRDRNLGAIIFWLRNNSPQYKTRVELTGRIEHIRELTEQEEKLIEHALRLALPKQLKEKNNHES